MIHSRLLLAIIVGVIMTSCSTSPNKHEEAPESPKNIVAPKPKVKIKLETASLASKNDPVCGMGIQEASIADTAVYEQKIYGFCSNECKDLFVKNPTSYLTQK